MSTQETATHFRAMSAAYPPARVEPERLVYRVGTVYVHRHPSESLGCATALFLTATYRQAVGRVVRFSEQAVISYLNASGGNVWQAVREGFVNGAYRLEGGAGAPAPRQILAVDSWDDLRTALIDVGPVLAYIPWSVNYGKMSRAWGELWLGPDGVATRGVYSQEYRGVVVKGIAHKFNGVRVAQTAPGIPDLWLPFTEAARLLGDGGRMLTAIF